MANDQSQKPMSDGLPGTKQKPGSGAGSGGKPSKQAVNPGKDDFDEKADVDNKDDFENKDDFDNK